MTRLSANEYRGGRVWNGFDYALQVWVLEGVIQPCGHPETMRAPGRPCCAAARLAGRPIAEVEGAESGPPPDPGAGLRDPLARILARHGSLRPGDLDTLPDRLPVVIKLGTGHRAATTAGQAPAFLALLGPAVAEVFVPVRTVEALRADPETFSRLAADALP